MSSDVNLKAPNTRTLSWAALIRKAWGDEYLKKETAYQFSNGRKFDSTDSGTSGIYKRP